MEATKKFKYYSGFIFHSGKIDPKVGLHCTHVYMDELTPHELMNVQSIIDQYFKFYGPIRMRTVMFDQPTFFGENLDIKVLTTKEFNRFDALAILRKNLVSAGYHRSEFKEFNPHITLPKDNFSDTLGSFAMPFVCYALIANNEIIAEWPIEKIS